MNKKTITDFKMLRINHEIDVYPNNKEINLKITDRLSDNGVTSKCLYNYLIKRSEIRLKK